MFSKSILSLSIFFVISNNLFAQKHTGVVSMGYGFPSIVRFILNTEKKLDIIQFNIAGAGPFHGKAEYIYKNKVGIGASAFYNTINFNLSNPVKDTFKYQVRDFCIAGRVNYYFINTPKQQFYLGAGYGRLNFDNKIIRLTNPEDTFLKVTPTIKLSNNSVSELTVGYRRQIKTRWNVFAEMGAGRVLNQFARKGAIDSYMQLGICCRIGKLGLIKKEKLLLAPPSKSIK
jgi:hypothetical protein